MIEFDRKYNTQFLKYVIKCISDFKLIQKGDSVAVGLSGGKDSIFLLFCLRLIQMTSIKDFYLTGLNIDLGLGMDTSTLESFCKENNIPLIIEKTNIGEVIFEDRKEKNPCSLCSKLRKGALVRVSKANGFNKIALGHNSDDVIETLFMNVIKVGKLGAFHPNLYYPDKNISIIRPLVYLKEDEISKYVTDFGLPVIESPCPQNKKTTREEMKNLLLSLEKTYPDIHHKIITALSNVDETTLWNKKE